MRETPGDFLLSTTLYVPYGSSRYGESKDTDLVRVRLSHFSAEIVSIVEQLLQELGLRGERHNLDSQAVTEIIALILRACDIPATAFRKATDEVVSLFPPPPREQFGIIVRACLNKDYPGVFCDDIVKDAKDYSRLCQALEWHAGLRVGIGVRFPTPLTARKATVAVVQYRTFAEQLVFVDTKSEYVESVRLWLPERLVPDFQRLLYDDWTDQRVVDEIFEYITGHRRDHRMQTILFRTHKGRYIIRCGDRFWYSTDRGKWGEIKDRWLHYLDVFDLQEVGTFSSVDQAMRYVRCNASTACPSRYDGRRIFPAGGIRVAQVK